MRKLTALLAASAVAVVAFASPAQARELADAPPNSVGESAIKAGAVTYPKLGFQSVTGYKVADKTLYGNLELVNGSVGREQLSSEVLGKLDTDKDTNGLVQVTESFEPKVITYIGGKFADRATIIGSFNLPVGTWLLNTSAYIARTEAGPAGTRPQIALRAPDLDAGTILGTEISPSAGRELSASAVKLVTVDEPTTIFVYGFGYNDNGSDNGSGQLKAKVDVTGQRVG